MSSGSIKPQSGAQDSALTAAQLQTVARDFNEVLSELQGDISLVRFREEYEALFRSLTQSHESESRLLQECSFLGTRIAESSVLVQQTVKEQHENSNSLLMLNKEISEHQTQLDHANFRVTNFTSARDAVVSELADLAGLQSGLAKQISDLHLAVADAQSSLSSLTEQSEAIRTLQSRRDAEKTRLNGEETKLAEKLSKDVHKIAQLRESIKTRTEECAQLESVNIQMLGDIHRSRLHVDELAETLKKPLEDVALFKTKTKRAKTQFMDSKKDAELLQNQASRTEAELVRLRRMNEEQHARLARVEEELNSRDREAQMLEGKLEKEQTCLAAAKQIKTVVQFELDEFKQKTSANQETLNQLESVVRMVELEVTSLERTLHHNTSLLYDCVREKEALVAATSTSNDKVNVLGALADQFRRTVQQKEQENRNIQAAIDQLHVEIDKLDIDKQEFQQKVQLIKNKEIAALNKIDKLSQDITDSETALTAIKDKIAQQKQHCEALDREQVVLTSTLDISNKELGELESKFDQINKKIKKMKDKLVTLDTSLVQTHLAKQKLSRNTEHFKDQTNRVLKKQSQLDALLTDQSNASIQLDQVLSQGSRETQLQSNEINTLIHEREIITRQLSRRSNELSLLYEKIRIQQSLLVKGASRFNQLVAEIDNVEYLLKQKSYTLNRISIGTQKLTDLYNEFVTTQRQLAEEQSKTLLLTEELDKKVNVHSFRRLMEADPELYEVIQKIQSLEKRIIFRSGKISNLQTLKDHISDDIEDTKLKIRRSRDPTELDEECNERRIYIRARNQQIRSLETEVTHLRSKIFDSKLELAKLADEKIDVMKKYYAGKSSERRLMETLQNDSTANKQRIQGKLVTSIPRMTGGGFCLSRPE